jgi:hypothetical protein
MKRRSPRRSETATRFRAPWLPALSTADCHATTASFSGGNEPEDVLLVKTAPLRTPLERTDQIELLPGDKECITR